MKYKKYYCCEVHECTSVVVVRTKRTTGGSTDIHVGSAGTIFSHKKGLQYIATLNLIWSW